MTLNPQQIRKPLLRLESPSILRMHLMNKITFDEAFGIEEFFRFRNQATYEPHVRRKSQMIADFQRLTRQLKGREGHLGARALYGFVMSPNADPWSRYDLAYAKRKGWMKELILFVGGKLDHINVYFKEMK